MSILNVNGWRLIGRELAAAIGVLSLILLSMAHQPIGVGGIEAYRLADGKLPVICGPGFLPSGEAETGNECDACRVYGEAAPTHFICENLIRFPLKARIGLELIGSSFFAETFDRVHLPRAPPIIA